MSNINKEYGKIYPSELQNFTNDYLVRNQLGGFLATKNYWSFSEYLNSKNKAYIIHKFYSNPLHLCTDEVGNKSYHTPKYIIDNYGNIYNIGQTNEYQNVSCLKFLKASDNRIFSYDQMHPYTTYNNKLSNKSIKIIKCIDSCSEDCMINLIKILLENDEEDNKVLEDTNKDLLFKMDEMKEKHNELINRLMDRIVEVSGKN
jgi:hypothetical protein